MLKSKLFVFVGETEMTDLALPKTGATEKYCFECGAVIRAKAEICPCGGSVNRQISHTPKSSNLPRAS
jgi:hypothetical protein